MKDDRIRTTSTSTGVGANVADTTSLTTTTTNTNTNVDYCDICWGRPKKRGMTYQKCTICHVGIHNECYGILPHHTIIQPFICYACSVVGTTLRGVVIDRKRMEHTKSTTTTGTSSSSSSSSSSSKVPFVFEERSITITERPTECCLCSVDDGTDYYHAMHPLYHKDGIDGKPIILLPETTTHPHQQHHHTTTTHKSSSHITHHHHHNNHNNNSNHNKKNYNNNINNIKSTYRFAWAHSLCCYAICSYSNTSGCVYGCTIDGTYDDGSDDDNIDDIDNILDDDDEVEFEMDMDSGQLIRQQKQPQQQKQQKQTQQLRIDRNMSIHHFVFVMKLRPTDADTEWTKRIRECQTTLKCMICGSNDLYSYRIAIQCSANDPDEDIEFRKAHTSLRYDETCYCSMHVGCAIWGRNDVGQLPSNRRVYFFPGLSKINKNDKKKQQVLQLYSVNDESSGLKIVTRIYCPVHAAELVRAQIIGADIIRYPSHMLPMIEERITIPQQQHQHHQQQNHHIPEPPIVHRQTSFTKRPIGQQNEREHIHESNNHEILHQNKKHTGHTAKNHQISATLTTFGTTTTATTTTSATATETATTSSSRNMNIGRPIIRQSDTIRLHNTHHEQSHPRTATISKPVDNMIETTNKSTTSRIIHPTTTNATNKTSILHNPIPVEKVTITELPKLIQQIEPTITTQRKKVRRTSSKNLIVPTHIKHNHLHIRMDQQQQQQQQLQYPLHDGTSQSQSEPTRTTTTTSVTSHQGEESTMHNMSTDIGIDKDEAEDGEVVEEYINNDNSGSMLLSDDDDDDEANELSSSNNVLVVDNQQIFDQQQPHLSITAINTKSHENEIIQRIVNEIVTKEEMGEYHLDRIFNETKQSWKNQLVGSSIEDQTNNTRTDCKNNYTDDTFLEFWDKVVSECLHKFPYYSLKKIDWLQSSTRNSTSMNDKDCNNQHDHSSINSSTTTGTGSGNGTSSSCILEWESIEVISIEDLKSKSFR